MNEIAISKIKIASNRRKVGDVEELATSIKELGLLNPVTINTENKLIAGHHRIKAFQALGIKIIPVRVIDCTQLQAELAEIDENLIRNELSHLDQGIQLSRRKAIYLELYPETAKGAAQASGSNKAQGNENDVSDIMSFTCNTAAKTRQTQRTVERKTRIGSLEENRAEIEAAGIENSQQDLTALVKLKESSPDQVEVVLDAIKAGTSKTVKAAIKNINGLEWKSDPGKNKRSAVKPKEEPKEPDYTALDRAEDKVIELNDTIELLQIAIAKATYTGDDATLEDIVINLREENKALRINYNAAITSRNSYQKKNDELEKQLASQRKTIKKLKG